MERKSIGTWLGVAFGVLVFIWVLFVLFFDIGEIDDSDLALPEREVDPAQNPYPEIRDLELSVEERADLRRVNGMLLGSEEMDSAFLLERLDRHRPLLDRFYHYSSMEEWQDRPEHADFSSHYASLWSNIVPLVLVDSAQFAADSKFVEVVDATLAILRFATKLQSNEIRSSEWWVGWVMREDVYFGLLSLLDREVLGIAELIRISEAMEDPFLRSQAFDLPIRAEYASNKAKFKTIGGDPPENRWIPQRVFYKKNRTMRILAEQYRGALRWGEANLKEAKDSADATAPMGGGHDLFRLVAGNWQGEFVMSKVSSELWNTIEFSFISRAFHELLRTRIALERYRLDRGAWPTDLAALVPAYLASVPLDPIDGKPLRYDRERKVLYSIGDNLIDEKGVAPDFSGSLRSRAEIVIELEPEELAPWPDFSQPAPADD